MQLRYKQESKSLRYAYSSLGVLSNLRSIPSPRSRQVLWQYSGMEQERAAWSQKEIERIKVMVYNRGYKPFAVYSHR